MFCNETAQLLDHLVPMFKPMLFTKRSKRRFLPALAVAGCLLGALPGATVAQTNPGLTIFSGVENQRDILNYRLDFGGTRNQRDRYRLRIPANRVELGVAQIAIAYPDYFTGRFDTDRVEVAYGNNFSRSASVSEVVWDQDNRVVQIYLAEPIESQNAIEIRLSNVRNPFFGGTFYFHGRVLSPGDVPLPRYVGTWILSIE